jgi:hypothetical protein
MMIPDGVFTKLPQAMWEHYPTLLGRVLKIVEDYV